jgi:hypothetical protein
MKRPKKTAARLTLSAKAAKKVTGRKAAPSKRAKAKARPRGRRQPTMPRAGYIPPSFVTREDCIRTSNAVLNLPDRPVIEREDIFRISAVGLDWDIGTMVYEPEPADSVARGADGKKIGFLLLHGGSGDCKSMQVLSRLFARKFGCKVVAFTFPGRTCFDSPTRDWPDDTIRADGSVRLPMWQIGERITRDQYDLVQDDTKRFRYGTRTVARAKPGTRFHDRMAGWPIAFEDALKEACRRNFPVGEYSIYVHGHSTGGPFVSMLTQRVENIAGAIAVENSPFGYIQEAQHAWSGSLGKIGNFKRVTKKAAPRRDPFDELYIRTWRDLARYRGPEALGQEGPQALMRLPWLMEEILDAWNAAKSRPQFKAEYTVTHNILGSLRAAAKTTAKRLRLDEKATKALIGRYLSLTRELKGPKAKPVPPFLFALSKDSRDHSPEVYQAVVVPMFKKMRPAPRVAVCRFGAGVHTYVKPEPDLPNGIGPVVAQVFMNAIQGGYYVVR